MSAAAERVDPKRSLAEHAILTLARLGYAQTSLREIAKCSGLSVGIVHYHFKDKVELISYCTHLFKEEFIGAIEASTSFANTPEDIIAAVIDSAVASLESSERAEKHRLWYDIRAQAMFDQRFQSALNEIEFAFIGLAERLNERLLQTGARAIHLPARDFYIAIDGFFRFYLQRRFIGDPEASLDFRKTLEDFLKRAVDCSETQRQVLSREMPIRKSEPVTP